MSVLKTFTLIILTFCFSLFSIHSYAQTESTTTNKKVVYKIDIKEEIDKPVLHLIQKSFVKALESNADLILIHMNTYGGRVDIADSIRTRFMQSKIPVIVFIDNNAASAGALISIACDSIYMRKGANIGAATVVNQNAEAMPDKYQSYMRSTMRSTAEAKNRNPEIAEAMVDPDLAVEGVIEEGKVLTFTTLEAIEHGFCEGQVETTNEAIEAYGFEDYEVISYKITGSDRIIRFLTSTAVHGILIMIIVAGIYFELQSPGVGFPAIASIGAAILYFAPLYIEGLAANWEIIIFIVGVILLAVEIFAIPGFGIAGALGITFMVTSLVVAMVDNVNLDFSHVNTDKIFKALFLVTVSMLVSISFSFYFAKKLFLSKKVPFGLHSEETRELGFIATDKAFDALVGLEAVAHTDLRPSGKIWVDNDAFDAAAESGYIEEGVKVKIIRQNKNLLVVRKLDD